MGLDEELKQWEAQIEMWRTLDVWPANGAAFPKSPQGGLWHDCSWVERCDALAAKVRKYEAGFDGIVAYRLRVCDDDSIRTLEEYGEVIDRLYDTFEADPKTGVRR